MTDFFSNIKPFLSLCEVMKKENKSMNELPFLLHWSNKIVERKDDIIYRADNPSETLKRILLQKLFKLKDLDVFAEEVIISELSSDFVTVTSQELFTIIPADKIEDKIKEDLDVDKYLKLKELFNKYQIQWYENNNSGINKEGKLKIFDYVANLTLTYDINGKPMLLDTNGEVLIIEEKSI